MELYINEESLKKAREMGSYQTVDIAFNTIVSHINSGGILFIKQKFSGETPDTMLRLSNLAEFENWKNTKFPDFDDDED